MTKNDYNIDIAKYQKCKDYTGDALVQCDEKLFEEFFMPAEKLFRKFVADDLVKKKGLVESLLKIFFKGRKEFFPCHNFDQVLVKRFFQIRLHLNSREINRIKKDFQHGSELSSKTVKQREMAKKHKSKAEKHKALAKKHESLAKKHTKSLPQKKTIQ